MDGLQRVRTMHGLRIRLKDVKEREHAGHIVIASLSGSSEAARIVNSGRLYSGQSRNVSLTMLSNV